MSKKKSKKETTPRIVYSKEIEAAWYVLSNFISNFDYVVRYTDINGEKQIITVNPNCVLAANMSKTDLFKPHSISKYMLVAHFNRDTIIFYKSSPNKKLSTGYGRYDKNALALSFSTNLNIATKRITDGKYYVLLVGIDIDCHNGEKHVKEVEELIKKYFPNTYWEDSTNGNGRHGYLKIRFINSHGVIEDISKYLKELFSKLEDIKTLHGYEAKIDDPAGLPYKIEFKDTNPYHSAWTTLFYKSRKESKFLGRHINRDSNIWKDYVTYLMSNSYFVTKKCYDSPALLSIFLLEEEIKSTFSEFLSDNNISFPAPTKNKKYYQITVQRAFKLPMFGATTSDYTDALPRMECIKEFHNLPYHTSSELKTAYNQICEDINNNVDMSNSTISLNSLSDNVNNSSFPVPELYPEENPYSSPIPVKEEDKDSFTQTTETKNKKKTTFY